MFENEFVKNVLLEELGFPGSRRDTETVIRAYEKRYGYRVSNWGKLEQDLRVLLESDYDGRFVLGRVVMLKVLEKGLNYVYVSSDPSCVKFREALFKARNYDFMRRVRRVFN